VGVDKIRDLLFAIRCRTNDRRFSIAEAVLQRFKDTESETARNLSAYIQMRRAGRIAASQLREEKDLRADGDKEIERSLREQNQSLESG